MLITDRNKLRKILEDKFPKTHGNLLPALHFLHDEFGYLPDWAMEILGWHLGIPVSEIYGAATSYTELRTNKPYDNVLKICTGISCWVNGGEDILIAAESEIEAHQSQTEDVSITFEECPCGFLCGMAPVAQMNGDWQGRATPESVKDFIRKVIQS